MEVQAAVDRLDQQYVPALSARCITAQTAIPRVRTLSTMLPLLDSQGVQSAESSIVGESTSRNHMDEKVEEDSEAPALNPGLAYLQAVKQEEKYQKHQAKETHEEDPAVHPHVAHLLKVKQEKKNESKSSNQGQLPVEDEVSNMKPWQRRERKRKAEM